MIQQKLILSLKKNYGGWYTNHKTRNIGSFSLFPRGGHIIWPKNLILSTWTFFLFEPFSVNGFLNYLSVYSDSHWNILQFPPRRSWNWICLSWPNYPRVPDFNFYVIYNLIRISANNNLYFYVMINYK